MGKILPLLLALLGLGAGAGAGLMLRPAPDPAETHAEGEAPPEKTELPPEQQPDYVKLNNQFIVPVVEEGRVASMVILSLSLEVTTGGSEKVYAVEPKLRDSMLQVLFDHANNGGFRGSFTDGSNLVLLRKALLEVGQSVLGEMVSDVLIVDIMRQDS
ncbi:flagellar basal body-associated FliL family protein [Cereibacter changlensis]|uniref:Flagellar basal body-associated FliL family protein n=1 Tax=Cereibacter changlensis TaxID=402884 RepID=A0A4U0Z0G5_9RHOB|nr:flagellar basal body-associated FliL family protein [Cereibacter changlensis]TKA97665.1 flagellar basal body-associated FliL family protein [Cereibacter changlensis]